MNLVKSVQKDLLVINKYYTPEIEEFYVGFGCEILSSYGWQSGTWPDVLNEDTLTGFDAHNAGIFYATRNASIRVKYLDQEDIESLGFKYNNSYDYWYKYVGQLECLELYKYNNDTIKIVYEDSTNEYTKRSFLYQGKCKNKSELKRILKMIGYDTF